MIKRRYYVGVFPLCSIKSPLAKLAKHVLRTIDHVNEILDVYADETYGESPRRILHNMMQNNETIFGLGAPDATACASTSNLEKSSQELSSLSKADSTSSCFKQKLSFEDGTKEDSVPGDLETTTTASKSQESVELGEKAEMLSRSVEDNKTTIATTKDAEVKTNPKGKEETRESKEDIKALIKRNTAKIRSISVIEQSDNIGVEIDIDLACTPDESSSETPGQDSSPSKKISSPGKLEKNKSPSSSPSKRLQSADKLLGGDKTLHTVDYSDPNILDFLAERLLSIFTYRKTCMEQIHDCFRKFQRDVRDFHRSIGDLSFVVERFPMANEPYFSDNLVTMRCALINKAHQMLEKVHSLVVSAERDTNVLEKCLNEIGIFEKELVPTLSTKGESIVNIGDLQKFELRLREICKDADGTVILKDGKRNILLKSSSDFQWLVKHFVKFLILTGVLKPSLIEGTRIGKDK